MKCIRCGNDSKFKDRTDRTCPSCKGKFAFEPKKGDPITDMLFHNAIKAVSGDGKIRWGVEHLYYEVCRKKWGTPAPLGCVIVGLFVVAFLFGLAATGYLRQWKMWPALIVLGGICFAVTFGAIKSRYRGRFVPIELSAFNGLWDQWRAVHGTPKGLIERAPDPGLPPDLEADIGDYSFDRAVICDRARTVDLLVANNFHFENNCAILSVDGYPKGPFSIILAMLKRNPRLQVFVLHDSTVGGCRLAQRLITDPDWFGGVGLRVIDLGLRPRHAGPFRGVLTFPETEPVDPGDGIDAKEAEWLTRYRLELAACRPEQVLKRLFAGLQAHAADDPRTADSTGAVMTCGAFDSGGYGGDGGDGGDGGGADAFG